MSRKGPRDKRNVRMTALAKDRKRPGRRVNDGERQYERRRYMKYAGCKVILSYAVPILEIENIPRGIGRYV